MTTTAVPPSGNNPLHPEYPTLSAFDTGHQFVVWCVHCRRWHFHSRENGHRVAHCHDRKSRYDKTGYSLHCIGSAPPAVLKDLKLVRPKGPDKLGVNMEGVQ